MSALPGGIIPALLTPVDSRGETLRDHLVSLLEYTLDCGVSGFYVGGSTGECFLMSVSQREEVLAIASETVASRVPLIAHIGAQNVDDSFYLAERAQALGYRAISAVTPYYYGFSFQEILSYYQELCEISKLPMVMYFIPALTGRTFTSQEIARLAAIPGMAGIKFTADDLFKLERLRGQLPDFVMYNGYDELLLPALSLGVNGAIGSTYNVTAPLAIALWESFREGDLARAGHLQRELNTIIEMLVGNNLYPTLKDILERRGLGGGLCRKPFLPLTASQKEESARIDAHITRVLASLG